MKSTTWIALILIATGAYGVHALIAFLAPTPSPTRDMASAPWAEELRSDAHNPKSLNFGFNKVVAQAAAERASEPQTDANAPHNTEAARIQSYLDRFSGNALADAEVLESAFSQLPGRENQTTRALLLRTLAAEVVEVEHRPLVRNLALKEVKTSLATLQSVSGPSDESADIQYHLQSMYELYLDHSTTDGRDLLLDAAEVIQNIPDPASRSTLSAIYMARFPDRAFEMKRHLKDMGIDVPSTQDRPPAPEAAPEGVE